MAQNLDVFVRFKTLLDKSGLNAAAKGLGDFEKKAVGATKRLDNLVKSSNGFTRALSGTAIFGGALKALRAFDAQDKALKKVQARLEAVKDTAGVTFDELVSEAEALQRNTLFGDEDILTNVTQQLLTFKDITGDVLKDTQGLVLDLSEVLGADLKSTAIQLGKALNDPVLGLSALARSGIQFSAEQKTLIKSLVETGEKAKAQKLILAELESQYGGAAAAAAKAGLGPMQQFRNILGDITEFIGGLIGPAVNGFARLGAAIVEVAPAFSKLIAILTASSAAVIGLSVAFRSLRAGLVASGVGVIIIALGTLANEILIAKEQTNSWGEAWALLGAKAKLALAKIGLEVNKLIVDVARFTKFIPGIGVVFNSLAPLAKENIGIVETSIIALEKRVADLITKPPKKFKPLDLDSLLAGLDGLDPKAKAVVDKLANTLSAVDKIEFDLKKVEGSLTRDDIFNNVFNKYKALFDDIELIKNEALKAELTETVDRKIEYEIDLQLKEVNTAQLKEKLQPIQDQISTFGSGLDIQIDKLQGSLDGFQLDNAIGALSERSEADIQKMRDGLAAFKAANQDAPEEIRKSIIAAEQQIDSFDQKLAASTQTISEQLGQRIKSFKDLSVDALDSFGSGLANALGDIADGSKEAGAAFKDFASTFLKQIAVMITRALILKAIKSALGTTGQATGGFAGQPAQGFNTGGKVSGPGTGTSDSIPAMLSNGEFVLRANAVSQLVSKFGTGFLDNLNRFDKTQRVFRNGGFVNVPKFQAGGFVNNSASDFNADGGGSGNVSLNIENNSSTAVSAENVDTRQQGKDLVVSIILEDADKNGPITRTLSSSRGFR